MITFAWMQLLCSSYDYVLWGNVEQSSTPPNSTFLTGQWEWLAGDASILTDVWGEALPSDRWHPLRGPGVKVSSRAVMGNAQRVFNLALSVSAAINQPPPRFPGRSAAELWPTNIHPRAERSQWGLHADPPSPSLSFFLSLCVSPFFS